MENIDSTASDSDDDFLSFGSQETDETSAVVFVVNATDILSNDENIDDDIESENGNILCELIAVC